MLYKESEWRLQLQNKVIGVALVSDNCKIYIDPYQEDIQSGVRWSKNGSYDIVDGVVTTKDMNTAKIDFDGPSNTAAIISKYGSGIDYASGFCVNYKFRNGVNGYLGSLGEWEEMYENKIDIDNYISLVNGNPISTDSYYWCSTQFSHDIAYTKRWRDGMANGFHKITNLKTRVFARLE